MRRRLADHCHIHLTAHAMKIATGRQELGGGYVDYPLLVSNETTAVPSDSGR